MQFKHSALIISITTESSKFESSRDSLIVIIFNLIPNIIIEYGVATFKTGLDILYFANFGLPLSSISKNKTRIRCALFYNVDAGDTTSSL